MNYKDELKIDLFNLDQEWLDHPNRVERWSTAHAEAEARKERQELRLDAIEAQIDSEIRLEPAAYGWTSTNKELTETFVKKQIVLDNRYQEARKKLILLRKEAKILRGAVKAFEHRKSALERLYDMWVKQYYARPYIAKDSQSSIQFPLPKTDAVLESKIREAQIKALNKNPRLIGKE